MADEDDGSLDAFAARVKRDYAAIDRSHWPEGVSEIDIANLSRFGVDENKNLYFDGKAVEIRRRLDLSNSERWFAIAVGFFTILGGIGAVAQGWAAAHQWSCQIAIVAKGCPTPGE